MTPTPTGLPVALVVDLARTLPAGDLAALATAAAGGAVQLAVLRAQSSNPVLRDACNRLVPHASAQPGLAGAIAGAAAAVSAVRAEQSLDLVWSGPDLPGDEGRLTGPALTELIGQAGREVLLVSYAAHDHPALLAVLDAALGRGVDITALLERREDNPAYSAGDAFEGLPIRRWVWSADRRPPGAALHAKLAVIDRRIALLGSANLTGRALTDNLECGVLIRGGPQPYAIAERLWSLRHAGVFTDLP